MFTTPTKSKAKKAKKVRTDNPPFKHASGRWAKKVRGKFVYLGKVADDPTGEKAQERWNEEKADHLAGRKPCVATGNYTSVRFMCNKFLHAKKGLVDSGERSQRTWDDYQACCERMVKHFGATRAADDVRVEEFDSLRVALAKQYGPERLATEIQKVRTVYKFAHKNGLIVHPIRFGSTFERPSAKVLRVARAQKGSRMLEAADIRAMVAAANAQMSAMFLLGINCGFGNSDVGNLPLSALDLEGGWVNFPRPKTGVPRRCKLWPETIKALRMAIASRRTPISDDYADLVFITRAGTSWSKVTRDNPVMNETKKVLRKLGIHRDGVGFYGLRRAFETIAGETADQVCVDAIMGHVDQSMAERYRQRIGDDRLKAVADHVHDWLYPPKLPAKKAAKKAATTKKAAKR